MMADGSATAANFKIHRIIILRRHFIQKQIFQHKGKFCHGPVI